MLAKKRRKHTKYSWLNWQQIFRPRGLNYRYMICWRKIMNCNWLQCELIEDWHQLFWAILTIWCVSAVSNGQKCSNIEHRHMNYFVIIIVCDEIEASVIVCRQIPRAQRSNQTPNNQQNFHFLSHTQKQRFTTQLQQIIS